jgi:hypothetical protein
MRKGKQQAGVFIGWQLHMQNQPAPVPGLSACDTLQQPRSTCEESYGN